MLDYCRALASLRQLCAAEHPSVGQLAANTTSRLRAALPKHLHSDVTIRKSDTGGFGIFADVDIPAGTGILVDHPVVSVLDSEVGGSAYSGLDGSDSIAMIQAIAQAFTPDVERCLRTLYPVRDPSTEVPMSADVPGEVVDALVRVLPDGMSAAAVIRAVQLNSLGFYTFPELCSYDEHLRFLSGTGLYETASMFNHSCDPNLLHYSIGDVTIFRTNRLIRANEELYISYIGSDLLCESKSIRDEFLDSRDFICSCSKCVLPESTEDNWLEELDLPTRIALALCRNPTSKASLIRQLIATKDYIWRDRTELQFMLCRELGNEGIVEWNELLDEYEDIRDFKTVVICMHYLLRCSFDSVVAVRLLQSATLCLGSQLGSLTLLGELFRMTDFGEESCFRERLSSVLAQLS